LLGTLPLLAVGSGATASSSSPPHNGLIAVQGSDGIYLVDPRTEKASLVPKSVELGDPAWSPDGTRLAVTSFESDRFDVFTMKPDGSERTLVLENAQSPSWSPDGKQLVVVRDCSSCAEEGVTSLAIVDADGKDVRALGRDGSKDSLYVSAPEWSPDGKLIAFLDDGGSVKLISPDGERVPLPAAPIASVGVSWSPDSSKLAYDRYDGKDTERAVVLDLASGRETVLPAPQGGVESPVWSPEGDQLVFNSREAQATTTTASCGSRYTSHLWVMAPDGTKAHQLGEGYLSFGAASWGRLPDVAEEAPLPPTAEKTTPPAPPADDAPPPAPATDDAPPPAPPADETKPPNPSTAPVAPAEPVRKPASRPPKPAAALYGTIAVRGEGAIYLVDPDSGKAQKVPGTAEMSAPAWSPDVSLLAVEKVEKGGGASIYTIRPDGTHPQLVLPDASSPSWSADGTKIYAVRSECSTPCDPEDDDANVVYAVQLDGGNAQRVDFEDEDVYGGRELNWPTDGSAIHFFEDEESLVGPGSFDSSQATWSSDGTQLAFTGSAGPTEEPGTGKTGLWIVSAEGGKPQLLLRDATGRPSWAAG
jgi:Tol biopolymer transport system component